MNCVLMNLPIIIDSALTEGLQLSDIDILLHDK